MNWDEIQEATCKVRKRMPVGGWPTDRLSDGLVAPTISEDTPRPCGSADPDLLEFNIYPSCDLDSYPTCRHGGFVETGTEFRFMAVAKYADGSTVDVTTQATWWIDDETIASIGKNTGIVVGLLQPPSGGGYSVDYTKVHAKFGNLESESCLMARSLCEAAYIDMVLVLDRTGSMNHKYASPTSAFDIVMDAAALAVKNMRQGRDKIGVVSFAGVWNMVEGVGMVSAESDATIDHVLSDNKTTLTSAIEAIEVKLSNGRCETVEMPAEEGAAYRNLCCTGLGAALQRAVDELSSSRIRTDSEKVILLLTDGEEQINDVDPSVVAAAAKAVGITIFTIGINVPVDYQATLDAMASTGNAYQFDNAEDVTGIIARIPSLVCVESGEDYYSDYGTHYEIPDVITVDDVGMVKTGSPSVIPEGYEWYTSSYFWSVESPTDPVTGGYDTDNSLTTAQAEWSIKMLMAELDWAVANGLISVSEIKVFHWSEAAGLVNNMSASIKYGIGAPDWLNPYNGVYDSYIVNGNAWHLGVIYKP